MAPTNRFIISFCLAWIFTKTHGSRAHPTIGQPRALAASSRGTRRSQWMYEVPFQPHRSLELYPIPLLGFMTSTYVLGLGGWHGGRRHSVCWAGCLASHRGTNAGYPTTKDRKAPRLRVDRARLMASQDFKPRANRSDLILLKYFLLPSTFWRRDSSSNSPPLEPNFSEHDGRARELLDRQNKPILKEILEVVQDLLCLVRETGCLWIEW